MPLQAPLSVDTRRMFRPVLRVWSRFFVAATSRTAQAPATVGATHCSGRGWSRSKDPRSSVKHSCAPDL